MKRGMVRRAICMGIAMLLLAAMPVQVLADTWCVDQGSISVSVDSSSTQTVSQSQSGGTVSKADASPVITNSNPSVATSNTITVNTAEGQTANFTVQNVNIDTGTTDKSAIDVGASSAVITVEGTNTIKQTGLTNGESAAVHVSSGDLTIQGDASDGADKLTVSSESAAIGSDDREDISGNIVIQGDAQITAVGGNRGAGIGTGRGGKLSGSITIDGGDISASCGDESVAIGADNELTGSITINGGEVSAYAGTESTAIGAGNDISATGAININGGEVYAKGGLYSAGIGTGRNGDLFGTITISGGNVEAVNSSWGAAIGTGRDGDIVGSINIEGGTVTAKTTDGGITAAAAIGTGSFGMILGEINISGGEVEAKSIGAAAIGTGYYGRLDGSIDISGGDVKAEANSDGPAIGLGYHGPFNGDITIRGDADVTAVSQGAAIGTNSNSMNNPEENFAGTIQILNSANVEVWKGYGTNVSSGTIGRGNPVRHDLSSGQFVVSTTSTINGVANPTCADDVDSIITFHKDSEGKPTNLTFVSPSSPEEQPGQISGEAAAQADTNNWRYALYQVLDEKGNSIPHTATWENGILTITTETDYAQLLVYGGNLKALMERGVSEIIFQTNGGVSQYNLAQVYRVMPSGTSRLTHDGERVSFTLNGAEHSELLQD